MKYQPLLLLATTVVFLTWLLIEQPFNSQAASSGTASVTFSPTPIPSPAEVIDTRLDPKVDRYDYPNELKITDILDMSFGTNDVDCDGVVNNRDNCVSAYNPKQADTDRDGEGDRCDAETGGKPELKDWRCDQDGDGILDRNDNCILVCNRKQADLNKDGVGDACDEALRPNFRRIDYCPKRRRSDDRKAGGYQP